MVQRFHVLPEYASKGRSKNLSACTVSFLGGTVHRVALDQGGCLVFREGHSAPPAGAVRGLCRKGQAAKFHQ